MTAHAALRHLQRAAAAAQIARHPTVERECRAALHHDPDSRAAIELLAWSLMEQRRYRAALEAARRGLRQHGSVAELHYVAAVVLHRSGRAGEARRSIDAALALEPRTQRFRARLARIASDQGRHDEAAALARDLVAQWPDDAFVLGEASAVLAASGALATACVLAERRVGLAPDDPWALGALARLRFADGDFASAVTLTRAALHTAPNHAWLWGLRAEALEALGRADEATHAALEALRIAPQTRTGGAAVARCRAARVRDPDPG